MAFSPPPFATSSDGSLACSSLSDQHAAAPAVAVKGDSPESAVFVGTNVVTISDEDSPVPRHTRKTVIAEKLLTEDMIDQAMAIVNKRSSDGGEARGRALESESAPPRKASRSKNPSPSTSLSAPARKGTPPLPYPTAYPHNPFVHETSTPRGQPETLGQYTRGSSTQGAVDDAYEVPSPYGPASGKKAKPSQAPAAPTSAPRVPDLKLPEVFDIGVSPRGTPDLSGFIAQAEAQKQAELSSQEARFRAQGEEDKAELERLRVQNEKERVQYVSATSHLLDTNARLEQALHASKVEHEREVSQVAGALEQAANEAVSRGLKEQQAAHYEQRAHEVSAARKEGQESREDEINSLREEARKYCAHTDAKAKADVDEARQSAEIMVRQVHQEASQGMAAVQKQMQEMLDKQKRYYEDQARAQRVQFEEQARAQQARFDKQMQEQSDRLNDQISESQRRSNLDAERIKDENVRLQNECATLREDRRRDLDSHKAHLEQQMGSHIRTFEESMQAQFQHDLKSKLSQMEDMYLKYIADVQEQGTISQTDINFKSHAHLGILAKLQPKETDATSP